MIRTILILCALLGAIPSPGRAECTSSRVEALGATLAEALAANLQVRLDRSATIMTAPFADLHDPKTTSALGRILGEETGNSFSRYGYRVADTRAFMPTPYSLKETGQTALTLEPDQAGATSGMQTILTGTYALADRGVLVSARIVQIQDHAILATASCRLRLTDEVRSLMDPSHSAAKANKTAGPLLDLKKRADTRRVQQALAAQGLYKGKIDGIWGRKSKAALLRFRASVALPADDRWDQATQAALLPSS